MHHAVRSSIVMVSVLAAGACNNVAPDADAELRNRYIERVVAEHDAGVRMSLFDRSDVRFDDGWFEVEYRSQRFARAMAEHSVLRLRSHGDQAMRLTLEGTPTIDPRKGPIWLTVTADGQRIAFFPIYGQYRAHFDVPAVMLRSTSWLDLAITASYAVAGPGDLHPTAYTLLYSSWAPLLDDGGAP